MKTSVKKSEDTDKNILVYFYPYLRILHQAWNWPNRQAEHCASKCYVRSQTARTEEVCFDALDEFLPFTQLFSENVIDPEYYGYTIESIIQEIADPESKDLDESFDVCI